MVPSPVCRVVVKNVCRVMPLYRVRISLDQPPVTAQMAVGKVVIYGEARAWMSSVLERIAAVLIRESGFNWSGYYASSLLLTSKLTAGRAIYNQMHLGHLADDRHVSKFEQ